LKSLAAKVSLLYLMVLVKTREYRGSGKVKFADFGPSWENNFKLIARKGTIVSLGNASGAVPPFPPLKLMEKNLKVLRPTLFHYLVTPEETELYLNQMWQLIESGKIKAKIHKEYPLSADGVKQSQQDIVSRGTSGKLLIRIA
jgi:NADPH2:quinone reductase